MARIPPSRLTFLVPAVVCLALAATIAVQTYEGLMSDFYWTPLAQAPTLDEAGDRVEVYLDGELVQRRAERGELVRRDGEPIEAESFRVRVNGRDQVQGTQRILLAAAAGAGVAFLLAALMQPSRSSRTDGSR